MPLLPFPSITLTPQLASLMAGSTLAHLGREYPHHQRHLLNDPEDARTPAALHPIFHGSFDWHSCVHGWWQVMRLARRFPDQPFAAEARARTDAMLTPALVAGEVAYFARPGTSTFERPYGWAWLLALHGELAHADTHRWANALAPLARLIAARLLDYLGRLGFPVRHGAHANTAFALVLSHQWAQVHDPALAAAIEARALTWFADDRPAPWQEPSGEDFLSPTLTVAALMAQVLLPAEAACWQARYADAAMLQPLTVPVEVSDRSDPSIAHLDGLNLSRAWCWRLIDPLEPAVADAHLAASLPFLTTHYMGEHWLATFALLALSVGDYRA